MTELYSTQITKYNADLPSAQLGSDFNVNVRAQHFTYEATAAPKGDTIVIGKLPAGAYLLPQSLIVADALGANTAIAVGTTASPALFLGSTVTTSATSNNMDAIAGIAVKSTDAVDIIVTISGSGAATNSIAGVIEYALV